VSKTLWQEDIEGFAYYLGRSISEYFLRALIEQQDTLAGIQGNDRVLGDFQNALKAGFAVSQRLFRTPSFDRNRRQVSELLDEIPLL
jgi:hypothetical protein